MTFSWMERLCLEQDLMGEVEFSVASRSATGPGELSARRVSSHAMSLDSVQTEFHNAHCFRSGSAPHLIGSFSPFECAHDGIAIHNGLAEGLAMIAAS